MIISEISNRLLARPSFRQFIKFCVVGGVAAVIHLSLLLVLTEWLKVWYLYSNGVGFITSATFNFFSNKFWTFRNREKGKLITKQVAKFSVVLLSGLALNTLIIFSLTDYINLDYRLSWFFATGVVTFWNYSFNRFWTFRSV